MTTAQQQQPLLVKYRDDDGNVRMSFVKDSKWKRYQENDYENTSEQEEKSEDVSAHLHEYARREGPNEDSDSVNERYNISDEEEFEGFEDADVYNENENDDESSVEKPQRRFSQHPYASDYVESDSDLDPEEKDPQEESEEKQEKRKKLKRVEKPCRKQPKKIVYVYKQPPIIVKPKPTNVYIKSKPILVQPPPLVVHHPQPKPCNPIIKYQPPNIKLKPVIVKISKPKTTTSTTTTPCPTTTKKPCRKCRRKPTKKCGRCSRRKQSQAKSSRPKDVTVYYNQHQYRASEPAQYVQYKNVKCADGCLT